MMTWKERTVNDSDETVNTLWKGYVILVILMMGA
jgi:hypothetical protein